MLAHLAHLLDLPRLIKWDCNRPGGISECRQDAGVTESVTMICDPRYSPVSS
jgi:hypothetical protein